MRGNWKKEGSREWNWCSSSILLFSSWSVLYCHSQIPHFTQVSLLPTMHSHIHISLRMHCWEIKTWQAYCMGIFLARHFNKIIPDLNLKSQNKMLSNWIHFSLVKRFTMFLILNRYLCIAVISEFRSCCLLIIRTVIRILLGFSRHHCHHPRHYPGCSFI